MASLLVTRSVDTVRWALDRLLWHFMMCIVVWEDSRGTAQMPAICCKWTIWAVPMESSQTTVHLAVSTERVSFQTSEGLVVKINCFGDWVRHKARCKELYLLVRPLMSHALDTIIHQVRHRIRPRSCWCPPWGRDNTALHSVFFRAFRGGKFPKKFKVLNFPPKH